ncbi:hypothetical protein AVEN_255765-1, partial [Araneus ventricosus]
MIKSDEKSNDNTNSIDRTNQIQSEQTNQNEFLTLPAADGNLKRLEEMSPHKIRLANGSKRKLNQ